MSRVPRRFPIEKRCYYSMQISQKKAMLLMALCAVLWSIGGLFIKLLPWHPAVICALRSAIAASIILLYMKRMGYRLTLKNPLVWLSGLALMGTMLLFVSANKLTTSANAIVLQSTSPLYIMVISAIFFGARYSRRELFLVAVVMFGIALFFFDQLTPGGLLGNILALCSGVTMASMFVTSGRLPDDSSSMTALVLGHLGAGLAGLPFLFLTPVEVSAATVSAILILGVFQLGVPYILYAIAVRRCSPLSCSLLGMIEPLLNPVWVLVVIGERPGFFALIGGIIVLGAVALWSIGSIREAS